MADFDLDGDLDLFLPRYPQSMPDMEGISPGVASSLLEYRMGGGFVDISEQLPKATNDGYPFVGGWHDLDLDGRPDLVLANDHGVEVRSNRAWQNTADGFVDRSEDWGLDIAIDAMGMAVGDFNRDGRPDLAWTGWPDLELLESQEEYWVRSGEARGIVPGHEDRQVGWGLDWGDLNNDGLLDLLVAYSHWENYGEGAPDGSLNPEYQPDALFIQQSDGSFEEVAAEWGLDSTGMSRSFVLADFNEDGWLDLVMNEIWGPTRLSLSKCGSANWVEVELEGPSANTKAIGARIEMVAGNATQTGWIHAGGTNIAAGGPPRAHFGLGAATEIDSIVVTWPDMEVSTFEGITPNQRLRITRSD
jgi:hypothetical protein